MSESQPPREATSTSGSGSDDPPGGQRGQPERPRGVESPNSPPPRHPHLQGAFNIAAVHATPQSPAPKPDEAPGVRPTSADDPGITQESGGVLAPRAGEVDLLHVDIGDLAKVQAQEAKFQRPRLEASRLGSVRFRNGGNSQVQPDVDRYHLLCNSDTRRHSNVVLHARSDASVQFI
jgi:hypothetical protein